MDEDSAIAVLRYFKWNLDKLQNSWFEKERVLRILIGLDFDASLLKSNPEIS
jgi:hypothetical protein